LPRGSYCVPQRCPLLKPRFHLLLFCRLHQTNVLSPPVGLFGRVEVFFLLLLWAISSFFSALCMCGQESPSHILFTSPSPIVYFLFFPLFPFHSPPPRPYLPSTPFPRQMTLYGVGLHLTPAPPVFFRGFMGGCSSVICSPRFTPLFQSAPSVPTTLSPFSH